MKLNNLVKTLLLSSTIVLTACSSNPATVILAISDVTSQVESGEIITKVKLETMTEQEIATIASSLDTLLRLKDKYSGLEEDPANLITNLVELSADQLLAENAYRKIYNISLNHWDEYNILDKWKLEQFDESANVLNNEVKALIKAVDLQEAAKTMYQLSTTTVQILSLI